MVSLPKSSLNCIKISIQKRTIVITAKTNQAPPFSNFKIDTAVTLETRIRVLTEPKENQGLCKISQIGIWLLDFNLAI